MKRTLKLLILASILLSITLVNAADTEEGKASYEEDCTSCHDSKVFTRKDRKINELTALKKQVHKCVVATEASWFEEDEENAVAYISETFYKFAKDKEAQSKKTK